MPPEPLASAGEARRLDVASASQQSNWKPCDACEPRDARWRQLPGRLGSADQRCMPFWGQPGTDPMRRQRRTLTSDSPTTWFDYAAAAVFYAVLFGWPLFVVVYRWMH